MIGVILIFALILCSLIMLIGMFYLRHSEIKITDKSVDISKVIPIQTITDNIIVNGNGDITVGYRMFLPEIFSLTDEDAENIHNRLEGLFKMLPTGTVIHQQSFFYGGEYHNDEYSTNSITQENLNYFEGKEIINSYSNMYLTFVNTNLKKQIRRKASNTCLLRKMNYPFKQPYQGFEEKLSEMEVVILNFEQGLNSISQFEIKRMNSIDLNNAVYDFMNVSYDKPTEDATKQTLNPITTDGHGNFKIGNKFIAVLSLTREGDNLFDHAVPHTGKLMNSKIELPANIKSKCSMNYPLGLGLPFNHVINVTIEVTDTDSTVSVINAEKQVLNYIAPFYPPAREKQKEQELFCNEIGQFEYQTAYTAFNVIIDDIDLSSLSKKIALAQQGFSFMNQSGCYVENAEIANLFFCGIPGNARSNYRGFVNTTKQAICYLMKESLYISDLKGHKFSDRFGKPVIVNLWDSPYLVNRNRIVIGPSGSGKSFWLNEYILQSFEKGNDIVIIDIGGSYRSMVELNNGKYFDSSDLKNFAFNPFLCEQDRNGKYLYLDLTDEESTDDLITTIVSILSFIWRKDQPITSTEQTILYDTITEFYDYINGISDEKKDCIQPNLIEYRNFLVNIFKNNMSETQRTKFDVEDLVLHLKRYTSGDLSFLLNGKENIDVVNDRLIAFDMEGISKKEYFPIIAIITLQLVTDKIKRRKGVNKELVIDEGLDFLKDAKFGHFIAFLYRTFRKKQGSITLAAQNVLFLKNMEADIRDSIIINCATKVILDHSDHRSNLSEIKNILSINDDGIYQIESLQTHDQWREFYIQLGRKGFVFRHDVSDFAAAAYDSNQNTVVEIRKYFKETGSTFTAINKYLQGKAKKYG